MFCKKCGNEIDSNGKFCSVCGEPVELIGEEVETKKVFDETERDLGENTQNANTDKTASDFSTETNQVDAKKGKTWLKLLIIFGSISVVFFVFIVIAIIVINIISTTAYKNKLQDVYEQIQAGATDAESYISLESKVWRNTIFEDRSIETDEYTQDDYGIFHDDFNDALSEYFDSNYLTYTFIELNREEVDSLMSELKNPPSKYEEEYRAIQNLYIAYCDMTDLVVGNTSHSLNSFTEAMNSSISDYNSAESAVRMYLD